jgi:hypothetical protein
MEWLPPRNHGEEKNCTNKLLTHHPVSSFRKIESISLALLVLTVFILYEKDLAALN